MSKSKEQLQQAVLDVGEQFAASMDTLLDTELRYLKYLRNRKRFHIGVRNIISNRLGSGQLPPDDPKSTRRRRNPRRPNPTGVGVPIPIPLFVPERQYENEEPDQEPIDVLVPEKINDRPDTPDPVIVVPEKIDKGDDDDDGETEIEIPETEPFEIPIIIPDPVIPPVEVPVPTNGGETGQVFDGPFDEIYNYEGASNFFEGFSLPQFNMPDIDWWSIPAGALFLLGLPFRMLGDLLTPAAYGAEQDLSSIYTQPTETIIGEDGAEVVLPVDELGDLISLVYKDGAQVFIGTSQDFLSGLPSSPGKTSVLGDANRLASIFGISDKGDGSSALSFGLEEPITFDSTSTEEKENIEEVIDVPGQRINEYGQVSDTPSEGNFKDQFPDEGTFDADMNYRPPGFEDATTIDNIVSDGSEQVKIPSDGNGEDRFGNDIILNNSTELAWQKAIRAAALDGVDLTSGVNSSFRTPDQQQHLLDLQAAGDPIVAQVAEIGTSPHQQGWGLDIAIGSPAHQWMLQNGKKYNFEWAGTEDAVHFNFVNNESNTKYLNDLQPSGSRNNMETDLAPVPRDKKELISKKAKAKISATTGALAGLGMMSNDIVAPDLQTDKAIVSNEQVNQIDKNQTMISTQPNMIPIPIQTTVQVPVPIAKNETKEIKRTLIIDTFDKGSRVEVAYV